MPHTVPDVLRIPPLYSGIISSKGSTDQSNARILQNGPFKVLAEPQW